MGLVRVTDSAIRVYVKIKSPRKMPLDIRRVSLTHAYPRFLDRGGWPATRPNIFNARERDPVPIVREAGWAVRSVWAGMDKTLFKLPGFEVWPYGP
jgi:hypothetical protein